MPGLDGIATTAELKAAPPGRRGRRHHELHRGGAHRGRDRGRRERLPAQGCRGGRPGRGDPFRTWRRGLPRSGRRRHRRPPDAIERPGRRDRARPRPRASQRLTSRERDVLSVPGPRPVQPGHRRGARDGRADGADARLEHPGQARAVQPDAGRPVRGRASAGRHVVTGAVAAVSPIVVGPPGAPAIVFVHGTRLTGSFWAAQLAALGAEFRTIALDLPGARHARGRAVHAGWRRRRRRGGDPRRGPGRPGDRGRAVAGRLCRDDPRRARARARPRARRLGRDRRAGRPARSCPSALGRGHGRASPTSASTGSTPGSSGPRYPPAIAEPIVAGGFWSRGGAEALRAWPASGSCPRLAAYPGPSLIVNGEFDLPSSGWSRSGIRGGGPGRPARAPGAAPRTSPTSTGRRPSARRSGASRGPWRDRARSTAGRRDRRLYWPDPPDHPSAEVRCAFERPCSPPPAGVPASCPRRRRSRRRCCRWSTSRSSSTRSKRPSRPGSSRSSSSPPARSGRSRTTSTSPTSSSTCSRRRATSRCSARSGAISDLAQVAYVRQKEQLGLGHAVLMAKDLIGHEPFAVILPDDVVVADRPCIGQLIHAYQQTHALGRRRHGGPAGGDRPLRRSSPRSRPRIRSTTVGCTG